MKSMVNKNSTMRKLLSGSQGAKIYKTGDLVKGSVVNVTKNRVWLEIEKGRLLGIISGKELSDEGIAMPDYKEGDEIVASVLVPENDEGFMLLSVREALKNKGWHSLRQKFEGSTDFVAKVIEANRGGLIMEAEGIRGFLPVSQLTPEHYPRVGSDKEAILLRLQKFEGEKLAVRVLDLDEKTNKLIFSEKLAHQKELAKITSSIKVGNVVEGKVTGVVDFGIFVQFDGLEGLVHISEISWSKVENVKDFAKVGDKLKVQIIGIDDDKISLSMKRLVKDPWLELIKKYEIGQEVLGEVTQIMPFGVFVKVNGKIDGLIHISELSFDHVNDPGEVVKVGDKLKLKIIDIGPESHRFGLSLKAMQGKDFLEGRTSSASKRSRATLADLELTEALLMKLQEAGIKSVTDLSKMSLEKLQKIKGVGLKTAEKIFEVLNKEKKKK